MRRPRQFSEGTVVLDWRITREHSLVYAFLSHPLVAPLQHQSCRPVRPQTGVCTTQRQRFDLFLSQKERVTKGTTKSNSRTRNRRAISTGAAAAVAGPAVGIPVAVGLARGQR